MANTVYGPYTVTSWSDGTTPVNQTHMNNLESQAGVALNGFNGDLLSAFVLSGMVCTKDGTTANQLDVTAGRAYATHSDGSRGLIITAASTTGQFTTSTPSTTYYLDLNPDGTWSFATAHSGQSNYLPICQVTTDGSGNISAVTDERTLNTTLLGGMGGKLSLGPSGNAWVDASGNVGIASQISWQGGVGGYILQDTTHNRTEFKSSASGAQSGHIFSTWSGSAEFIPFSIGGQFASALSWVDNSGNYNGPVGGGIPTTRNGTATSAGVYTGANTPTGNGTTTPATGAMWAKA